MQQDREHDRTPSVAPTDGDDARRDPGERYGNEEDQHSREGRRAYRDQDLERRLHDDRPYNRPGYEPEGGLPGGRENVDLDQEPGQSASPPASPYDQGEVSSWYGGDTGMGDSGSSLDDEGYSRDRT